MRGKVLEIGKSAGIATEKKYRLPGDLAIPRERAGIGKSAGIATDKKISTAGGFGNPREHAGKSFSSAEAVLEAL